MKCSSSAISRSHIGTLCCGSDAAAYTYPLRTARIWSVVTLGC